METKGKSAHTKGAGGAKFNKKSLMLLVGLFIVLIGVVAGLLLVQKRQTTAPKAVGPSCPADALTCSWNREPGVSYSYTIYDITSGADRSVSGGSIPGDQETTQINVHYQPQPDHTYRCSVTASNGCSDDGQATCIPKEETSLILPTETATPTPSTTQTPTPTPQGTSTRGGPSPTATPTPKSTSTSGGLSGTPTGTSTSGSLSPTPTDIIIVNATNTPTPTGQTGIGGADVTSPSNTPTKTPTPTSTSLSSGSTGSSASSATATPASGSSSSSSSSSTSPQPTITLPASGVAQLSLFVLAIGILAITLGLLL